MMIRPGLRYELGFVETPASELAVYFQMRLPACAGRSVRATESLIADLESAQSVVGVLQGHAEGSAESREFDGKGIRIGSVDEGVPAWC